MSLAIVKHNCYVYLHNINYMAVVINCMCTTFNFVVIGMFRYFLSVVVECPDLLLMFFVCYR